MAKRYSKPNTGLHVFCVIMTLLMLAVCTLGGLQLWGTGKMKPSEWFKNDGLAPVTISLQDVAVPVGAVQTAANGARAYALTDLEGTYPSTKRATATCRLPDGTPTFQWSVSPAPGELKIQTSGTYRQYADLTAQAYFADSVELTAEAYLGGQLRGTGSIFLSCKYIAPPKPDATAIKVDVLAAFTNTDATYYASYRDQFMSEIESGQILNVDDSDYQLEINPINTNGFDPNEITNAINIALDSDSDTTVLFDWNGKITQMLKYLGEDIGPFIVIDNDTYYPEFVEEAGGTYLTNNIDAVEFIDTLQSYANDHIYEELHIALTVPVRGEEITTPLKTAFDDYGLLCDSYYISGNSEPDGEDIFAIQNMANSGANVICLPTFSLLSTITNEMQNYGKNVEDFTFIILDLEDQDFYSLEIYVALAYQRSISMDDFYETVLGQTVRGEIPQAGYLYQCDMIT